MYDYRSQLQTFVGAIDLGMSEANEAREAALPGCRQVIRLCGSSIKAAHRREFDEARSGVDEARNVLRDVQAAVAEHPSVEHAGFVHDAEKEFVEACCVLAMVQDEPLPTPDDVQVGGPAYLRGLAEAASELRRHMLDRLRDGEFDRAEELLVLMEDIYESLMTVDYPDAITSGLRRTLDALRAVLERSRADLTTTALQLRLQRSLDDLADRIDS